jgi:hypothetical protein
MKRSVPAPVYAVKFDVCVLGQLGFEQLNLLRWLQMKPLHAATVRLNILAGEAVGENCCCTFSIPRPATGKRPKWQPALAQCSTARSVASENAGTSVVVGVMVCCAGSRLGQLHR